MGALRQYLTQHPWQRRSLSLMLMLVLCSGGMYFIFPRVQDHILIGRLGNSDPEVRKEAIIEAIAMVQQFPHTEAALKDALVGTDDRTFESVVIVLQKVKKFDVSKTDVLVIDRYNALTTLQSASPQTRAYLVRNFLLCPRDNPYVRQVARSSVRDAVGEIRRLSAVLAAALHEEDALKVALRDEDPGVQSWAAMSAALADCRGTEAEVAQLFEQRCQAGRMRSPSQYEPTSAPTTSPASAPASKPTTTTSAPASEPALTPVEADREIISAAALALAKFHAAKYVPAIAAYASATRDVQLRERLLHVLAGAEPKVAGPLVAAMIEQCKDHPTPALLLAAGKLGLAREADPLIRRVLHDVTLPDKPQPVALVRAALQSGRELHLALEAELMEYCKKMWYPVEEPSLMMAAELLGEQPVGVPEAQLKQRRLMLDGGANRVIKGLPDKSGQVQEYYTPFASAAAAVALWQMNVPDCSRGVKDAVDFAPNSRLVAHFVAWRLARIDPDRAWTLALTMLPPLDAKPGQEEDRDRVRTCGAILLALTARTDEQKTQAVERIASRLESENDFYVKGSYKSALLILGQKEQTDPVISMFEREDYPRRETLSALSASGNKLALEGLLWNLSDEDLAWLLQKQLCLDVVNAVRGLPRIAPAAYDDLLFWQMRIVRCGYAVHRGTPLVVDLP